WTKPVDNALVLGTILAVTRSKSELVLIVPGLIARQATVGGVTIGGDRNPLMASEGMVFVTENMPLMPPQLSKDAGFVNDLREAAHEGDVETIIAWLFLMLQWWMPTCLIGTIFAFAELVPRLFVFHPIVLAVLWAAVASVLSWGVWWVKRKSAPICQTETSLGRCEAEK
ncbi:MAG: hypothetical protein JW918_00820, partial [Anaerolineae bacterium]|nr:hypothetical protein [Anaerolineae bacterium]